MGTSLLIRTSIVMLISLYFIMCCIITEGYSAIYKVQEKDRHHFVIKTEGKPYNGDDYENQISSKNYTKPANGTNEVLPEKTSNNAKGSKKATKKTKISGDKMDDVIDKAKNTSKQANETKEGKPYNGDNYKNHISSKNDTKPANGTNKVL